VPVGRIARTRIEHIVVLMLENRSFDHLFAYLDSPPVAPYPNPLDLDDKNSPVFVINPQASYDLPLDPPHSHLSVIKQLNKGQMNGFVAAYAEKAVGKEQLPIIHWWRLEGLVLLLAAIAPPVGWLIGHEWLPAILVSLGVALLGTYALMRLPVLSGKLWWTAEIAVLIASVLLAFGARGLHLLLREYAISGWLIASGVTAAVGSAALAYMSSRPRYKKPQLANDEEQLAAKIMRCMSRDRIPVLAKLADEFTVCTRWHSSVPGATWPNRNFAHAATSCGTTDIEVGFYDDPTIFEKLEEGGKSWSVYYHDFAQLLAFHKLWDVGDRINNWRDLSHFRLDVSSGRLSDYVFIEPNHGGEGSNSQHPGNNTAPAQDGSYDFERGEQLIRDVYEALRSNHELFKKTLLLITYDEHGGTFDHVPPPRNAKAPTIGKAAISWTRRLVALFVTYRGTRFHFHTLGPRVPAVVVSPWIPKDRGSDPTLYDHSSIVASVRALHLPGSSSLTRRDKYAKDFLHLVEESEEARLPSDIPPLPPPLVGAAPPPVDGGNSQLVVTTPASGGTKASPGFLDLEFEALAQLVREHLKKLGVWPPSVEALDEEALALRRPYWDIAFALQDLSKHRPNTK
jgi:phospholipase C